ncbi:MAG: ribonucleoside-diphosphate reductase subunit alpha [Parachlamydiaceae bacterium]|nr:ribonucleoside-diphosphate reductase subunit alpha [Parachlamydiaceae bacterium]
MKTELLEIEKTLELKTFNKFPSIIRRDLPHMKSSKPRLVTWNGSKIEKAVNAACAELGHESIGRHIQIAIEFRMEKERSRFIHIEQLQDLVENLLIELNYGTVALAYGKHRARRAALREIEAKMSIYSDSPELISPEFAADLRLRISFARIGLNLILSDKELIARLMRSVALSLTPQEQRETVILNARNLLDVDADSRFFAGRILLTYIYEETLPWKIVDGIDQLKAAHRKAFLRYIPLGIKLGRLDARLAEFKLEELADNLDPYADLQFDFIGIQNLYDRYLIHTKDSDWVDGKRRIESPQIFWMRVAMGLALLEQEREKRAIEFFHIYQNKLACSSTPTLFNAGTLRPQLSSCYLLYCGDSIEDISETWTRFALLSKWAGGLGCSWTAVRGCGAHIHGTNGDSSGLIPFLKVANDICVAVNQGGKRPGALCSYIELWHSDIEDFLDLRKETGDDRRRTHNMNTALWIPDLFMKRLQDISEGRLPKDANWTFFRANETSDLTELYGSQFEERYAYYERLAEAGEIYGNKIRVLALWKKMISAIFETGHPWITFKDPSNIRSPQDHVGVIHCSNLCTEITLNTSKEEIVVCNLASINLPSYICDDGSIDHEKLRSTIEIVMRMLDNVIEINYYPSEAAKLSNMRHRPVGLGMMGMQDALNMLRIPFDSMEAVDFNDEITEAVAFYAYSASADLAAERGRYSSFKGSKWDRGLLPLDTLELLEKERGVAIKVDRKSRLDWDGLRQKIQDQGMRNSNCLAIAPTATISNIMGSMPCIEPSYKHIHTKSNLSGEFVRTNTYLVKELMDLALWDEEMLSDLKYFDGSIQFIERIPDEVKLRYKTAFEIEPTWLLQCAAVRQKWLDQSQSVNLFLAENDARQASFMYREAWERGLKTTYYLRTINKSSMDSANRDRKKNEVESISTLSACSIEAMRNGIICESCQ